MYLEPWMIIALIVSFGACAILNYRSGRRNGIFIGIEGAFEYLQKHKIIEILKDGTLKGTNRRLKSVDIFSDSV